MSILLNSLIRVATVVVLMLFSCIAIAQQNSSETTNSNDIFMLFKQQFEHKLKIELQYDELTKQKTADEFVAELNINDELLKKIASKYTIYIKHISEDFADFQIRTNQNYSRKDWPTKDGKLKRQYEVIITMCESGEMAREALFSTLASLLSMSSKVTGPCHALQKDSQYHLGDFCGYSQDDFYIFCHSNVAVIIFSRFLDLSEIYPAAQAIDTQIKASIVPSKEKPAQRRLVLDSSHIEKPKAYTPKSSFRQKTSDFIDGLKYGIKKMLR